VMMYGPSILVRNPSLKHSEPYAQRRCVAKNVGRFQRRLSVCLFVNKITSERVSIG